MDKNELKKISSFAKKIKAINLLGGKCRKCGENNVFKLCFHHLDKNIKDYTISRLKDYRWSLIEKEIKKCELLCQNCHHEEHFNNDIIDDRRRIMKSLYLEYKNIYKCETCGYDKCLASLDLHHVNRDKDFKFSRFCVRFKNIEELYIEIQKELDKCNILCKNCHSETHSDKEFFYKNLEKIMFKSNNLKELQKKINREDVIGLYKTGMRQKDIAKKLKCGKSTISLILKATPTEFESVFSL